MITILETIVPVKLRFLYRYFAFSVCLYSINIKTAEQIGPKFCVGPHVTPGKVYEESKFAFFIFIKF